MPIKVSETFQRAVMGDSMDFKLPNITIITDASPSSSEGYVEAQCVFAGVTVSALVAYTPVSWSSASHAMAVAHAVIELKKKITKLHEDLGESDGPHIRATGGDKAAPDIIGKTVQLKSGGTAMTAAKLADDGGILCMWFDAQCCVYEQVIPLAALEVVLPPGIEKFSKVIGNHFMALQEANIKAATGMHSADIGKPAGTMTADAVRALQGAAAYTGANVQQSAGKVKIQEPSNTEHLLTEQAAKLFDAELLR